MGIAVKYRLLSPYVVQKTKSVYNITGSIYYLDPLTNDKSYEFKKIL